MSKSRIKVAVIGSGNIGMDLTERLLREDAFDLVSLIGRRADSPGLASAKRRGIRIDPHGLSAELVEELGVDGYFDATSAMDHVRHWRLIQGCSKAWVVDLTPSRVGVEVIPVLDRAIISDPTLRNFNMITCGGQSAGPLVHAMVSASSKVLGVEVSSSIASDSAGPATRRNLDNYINATEAMAQRISGAKSKAILVLNPALPQVMMRSTVTLEAQGFNLEAAKVSVSSIAESIRKFVPGYSVLVEPTQIARDTFMVTASVEGEGLFLPRYAGNLDIINASGIETARIASEVRR